MVDTLARRQERLVALISAVRRSDLELVGGKGANLGEMMQAGFPVPDGFIVSTEAYAAVVEDAGLAGRRGRRNAQAARAPPSAQRSRTSRSRTDWPTRSARRTQTSAAGR